LGFERSVADHSLYFAQKGPHVMLVLVYVDDLIIFSSNMESMDALKSKLEGEFKMMDLGELHYRLGVEFTRDRAARTITMSQAKYVEEVLKRFGIEDCKPIGTPLDTKVKFVKLSNEEYDADAPRMGSVPYKFAVGSLMYTMVATKADLAFAISTVSPTKYCPTKDMLVDVLTKALARERHERLTSNMDVGDFGHSQSGSVER
jgi:hypothetical protein